MWSKEERIRTIKTLKEKIGKEVEKETEKIASFQKKLLSEEILDYEKYNDTVCILFCIHAFYDYVKNDNFLMKMYRKNPDIYIVSEDVIGYCLQNGTNVLLSFVYVHLLAGTEKEAGMLDVAFNIVKACNDEYFQYEFISACEMIIYRDKHAGSI